MSYVGASPAIWQAFLSIMSEVGYDEVRYADEVERDSPETELHAQLLAGVVGY
jgi:hypothetical protein